MLRKLTILAVALSLALPTLALADTFTDDFEGGSNVGGWHFLNHSEIHEPAGGNPGEWIHNDNIFSFAAILKSVHGAPMFTGNYNEMGVTKIGGDFQTLNKGGGSTAYYPMSILLRSENGTPGDHSDDDYIYYVNDDLWVPQIGDGWVHYEWDIPVGADELPMYWYGGSPEGNGFFRPGVTLDDVLANVDAVEFWWIHPDWVALFDSWDAGTDNIFITTDPSGVANEAGSWGGVKALFND